MSKVIWLRAASLRLVTHRSDECTGQATGTATMHCTHPEVRYKGQHMPPQKFPFLREALSDIMFIEPIRVCTMRPKMLRLWRLRQSTNASINSRLLSVNHALISPILTHLVIWSSGIFSIGSIDSPLSSSITTSLFHSRLKTFLFWKSFPP